jgi:hypothetical protein
VRLALFAAALSLTACASLPTPGVPVTGEWGSEHIGLRLGPAGGNIDYDCAAGTIGPFEPGPDGGFVASGTHTTGFGGPERVGQVRPTSPAQFSGSVRGDRMTLRGRLDNGVELGPFELRRGATPMLLRCL